MPTYSVEKTRNSGMDQCRATVTAAAGFDYI